MKNRILKFPIFTILLLSLTICYSQSYHATNGSPYAGVTGIYTNPASSVNSPYKWDLTLLGAQFTTSNTAFTVENGSISNYDSATIQFSNGLRSRYFHANVDINLLNFRMNIGEKSAFAFALRGRGYINANANPFYYDSTISSAPDFLNANKAIDYFQGYGTHSGWIEADLNYSQILFQNTTSKLTGGITIGYMRGISGGHTNISRVSYTELKTNVPSDYILTGGAGTIEYSSNYDLLDANKSISENTKAFLKNTLHSFNLSFGAEYLVRKQSDEDNIPLTATNYDWKFAVSIMDIGTNKFNPANGSFSALIPQPNISYAILQQQLNNPKSLTSIRDSLINSVKIMDTLSSVFTIANPTRMVINIDKNLGSHFYLNSELSVNFFATEPKLKLRTRELNLLTVTPRWETSAWGAYLPIQYNTQGQLWVGAAVKLGPLLIGIHSLDFFKWFKTGTQSFNGGGYIVLNVHPFGRKVKEQECPSF